MKILGLPQEQFEKVIESALQLDLPYLDRGSRELEIQPEESHVPAAVLVLFAFPGQEGSRIQETKEPFLLFIRRTELVGTHKGQMAFPGGHCEPEDLEGPVTTALRETEEEVGIPREKVQILGKLPPMVTITKYFIQPVVGLLKCPWSEVPLQLDSSEIADAIWIPLRVLLDSRTYRREVISAGPVNYPIHVYQVDHHRIWGATGSMTKNLLDRLCALS
jgi:8-oxo-dGTP pyrophosphatase MutT (NUDIX family)